MAANLYIFNAKHNKLFWLNPAEKIKLYSFSSWSPIPSWLCLPGGFSLIFVTGASRKQRSWSGDLSAIFNIKICFSFTLISHYILEHVFISSTKRQQSRIMKFYYFSNLPVSAVGLKLDLWGRSKKRGECMRGFNPFPDTFYFPRQI